MIKLPPGLVSLFQNRMFLISLSVFFPSVINYGFHLKSKADDYYRIKALNNELLDYEKKWANLAWKNSNLYYEFHELKDKAKRCLADRNTKEYWEKRKIENQEYFHLTQEELNYCGKIQILAEKGERIYDAHQERYSQEIEKLKNIYIEKEREINSLGTDVDYILV